MTSFIHLFLLLITIEMNLVTWILESTSTMIQRHFHLSLANDLLDLYETVIKCHYFIWLAGTRHSNS